MPVRPLDTLIAIKVINLVSDLRQSDRRVAVMLIEHFNRKTGRCDPGLKRLADLLGYCERTVIRSTQRLERAGLIRKVRHGGYSNRNRYEPNWPHLSELARAWDLKLWSKSPRPELSVDIGHSSHLRGDSGVTQTYRSNLPQQTCCNGHPTQERKSTRNNNSYSGSFRGIQSADAARTQAERRWHGDVHQAFGSLPITYAEIIEAVDLNIASAATDAELSRRGGGLSYIVQKLGLEGESCT